MKAITAVRVLVASALLLASPWGTFAQSANELAQQVVDTEHAFAAAFQSCDPDALDKLTVPPLKLAPVPRQADEQVEFGHEATEVAPVLLLEYVVAAKVAQIGRLGCERVGEDPHGIRSNTKCGLRGLDKERPVDRLVDIAPHGEDVIHVETAADVNVELAALLQIGVQFEHPMRGLVPLDRSG